MKRRIQLCLPGQRANARTTNGNIQQHSEASRTATGTYDPKRTNMEESENLKEV